MYSFHHEPRTLIPRQQIQIQIFTDSLRNWGETFILFHRLRDLLFGPFTCGAQVSVALLPRCPIGQSVRHRGVMAEQVLLSHRSNWQLRSAPESRDMEPWLNGAFGGECIWPYHSGSWFVMRHVLMHARRCGVMQRFPGRSFSQETLSQRWWLQGSAADWSQSGLRI